MRTVARFRAAKVLVTGLSEPCPAYRPAHHLTWDYV